MSGLPWALSDSGIPANRSSFHLYTKGREDPCRWGALDSRGCFTGRGGGEALPVRWPSRRPWQLEWQLSPAGCSQLSEHCFSAVSMDQSQRSPLGKGTDGGQIPEQPSLLTSPGNPTARRGNTAALSVQVRQAWMQPFPWGDLRCEWQCALCPQKDPQCPYIARVSQWQPRPTVPLVPASPHLYCPHLVAEWAFSTLEGVSFSPGITSPLGLKMRISSSGAKVI